MVESKIIQVFTSSGLSRVDFANKLGISNAVLSHLASGRNKASLDLVIAILTHFPRISADWLILDKGEMYKSDKEDIDKLKHQMLAHIETLRESNLIVNKQLTAFEKGIKDLK